MANRFHAMHVTFLLAHPYAPASMKRVAQALHRYLPVPSEVRTVSREVPAILHAPLPAGMVHVLYVLHARRFLRRMASHLGPQEVVHLVDHSDSFLLSALSARLKVVTCHDLIPLIEPSLYRHPWSRWLGRCLYWLTVRDITRADGVIASSFATAQHAQRLLGVPSERLRVVYHGVDADFFVPLPAEERRHRRQMQGFHPHEIVLLHVGSNAPYKNIPAILYTLTLLRQQGHFVRWIKAGQPLSAPLYRLARRLGVADCVQVEPFVDDMRLRELYQICDLLLFPSLQEGFGLPVLEALACGTPAVIADTPALNEWARDVCPVAPPRDARALAERVLQSAQDSHSETFRDRLREFAEQYHWRRITAHLVEAYRQWETPCGCCM